jgi:hypothetical protein
MPYRSDFPIRKQSKMLQLPKIQTGKNSSNVSIAEHIQIVKVQSKVQNNAENLKFFRRAFGITLLLTFGVVYLQGFGAFHLSDGVIYTLCAATVGQLTGLFVLVLRQK